MDHIIGAIIILSTALATKFFYKTTNVIFAVGFIGLAIAWSGGWMEVSTGLASLAAIGSALYSINLAMQK